MKIPIKDGFKRCSTCRLIKPHAEFGKDRSRNDGLKYVCSECCKKRAARYYSNHKEEYKQYRIDNKERIEKRTKQHYVQNRDRFLLKNREYCRNNKDKLKQYRLAHREENLKRQQLYSQRPEVKIDTNRRNRIYLQKNPKAKLGRSLKNQIYQSLRDRKGGRHWESLVGYSIGDLMKHIEKQFQTGMTWDNYGEWHVDHIVPVAAHNFTKAEDEDFKRCWALENLQPLWATDNHTKSDKLEKHFQPSLAF